MPRSLGSDIREYVISFYFVCMHHFSLGSLINRINQIDGLSDL